MGQRAYSSARRLQPGEQPDGRNGAPGIAAEAGEKIQTLDFGHDAARIVFSCRATRLVEAPGRERLLHQQESPQRVRLYFHRAARRAPDRRTDRARLCDAARTQQVDGRAPPRLRRRHGVILALSGRPLDLPAGAALFLAVSSTLSIV